MVRSLEKLGRSCVTLSRPSVLEKRSSILCWYLVSWWLGFHQTPGLYTWTGRGRSSTTFLMCCRRIWLAALYRGGLFFTVTPASLRLGDLSGSLSRPKVIRFNITVLLTDCIINLPWSFPPHGRRGWGGCRWWRTAPVAWGRPWGDRTGCGLLSSRDQWQFSLSCPISEGIYKIYYGGTTK